MDNKIIVLDFGMYLHRAGYASKNNPNIPPTYTCLNMMVSNLIKIGLEPMDKVIVACDGRGNWRKDLYDKAYKGNRKDIREKSGLDWNEIYKEFDVLLDKIDKYTDFHVIKLPKTEADDIASTSCRFYKDNPIVLVSFDGDWEMLLEYDNVKLFSPLKKYKSSKGAYKIKPDNFNVYKILSKKINKEVSDNLITEINTAEDFEKRMKIVNLLELPDFVEEPIVKILKNLQEKHSTDYTKLGFKSIIEKLNNIYNMQDKIITYEDCIKYNNKKKKRK